MAREASAERNTKETEIKLKINLDEDLHKNKTKNSDFV